MIVPALVSPPLSLYIHLPWCERKCPYCDFNSFEARGPLDERAYVDALLRDIDACRQWLDNRSLTSIFIGGGTPSLFSIAAIERLLRSVREHVSLGPDIEITLEANPSSAEATKFHGYRQAGVNRLSIGVQSFQDAQLRALGRVHSAHEATDAIKAAHDSGFDAINVDLMYGLPGDSAAAACDDLSKALETGIPHLSWYQLTLEPNTQFHHRPPTLPAEETILEIEERGAEQLRAAGFSQYEISAWAKPARQSQHNLNYWTFGDYLGIGAGAHGKVSFSARGEVIRTVRPRNPLSYVKQAGSFTTADIECVDDPSVRTTEFLMNALRLEEGVTITSFEQAYGR